MGNAITKKKIDPKPTMKILPSTVASSNISENDSDSLKSMRSKNYDPSKNSKLQAFRISTMMILALRGIIKKKSTSKTMIYRALTIPQRYCRAVDRPIERKALPAMIVLIP